MHDKHTLNKIAISLDIMRQYDAKLRASGEETRLYTIDGYGERISFRELMLGLTYVFGSIYGEPYSWYGYPNSNDPETYIMHILWGEGLIGWNRQVTNPIIDLPKALRIYEQLSASASSYKDKHARLTTFKKLFYRTDTLYHNYFMDGTDATNAVNQYMTAGALLYNENVDFYNYCKDKLENLSKLAKNEAKNVTVPTKLKFLFDSKPEAVMYDAEPEDVSYKDGLLNINSVVIQANQFYLTFLTTLEQILYQYTRQTFPIKLFGIMANLYSSYVKLIVNYLKPYHARLIDLAPILRFGSDLFESVSVGDQLEYNFTQQIFTDVYEWSFDNPYDWVPTHYDQMKKIIDEFYFGGSPDEEETAGITYQIIDEWRYNHRIDQKLWYTDKFDKDIFEDFNVIVDSLEPEVKLSPNDIPVEIYPSILYTTLNKYECLGYDAVTGTIENLLDRDLILITKNYCTKDQYMIKDIKTGIYTEEPSDVVLPELDESYTATMMVMLDDIIHGFVKVNNKWVRKKIPVVNDIFNGNRPPAIHMDLNPSMRFNTNLEYLNNGMTLPSGYHNFIRLLIYLPAHGKVILPTFNYMCRIKHYT